jgi:glycosyltransferase involved in cell wall biosynthesis
VALFAEAFLPKVDGVSKTAFLALRYLQMTGREVLVFAPDTAVHAVGKTRVIPLPSLPVPHAPETRVAVPHPLVIQQLDAFKPDLIHMFSPALLSWSGMVFGRQNRIPIIANYQTDLPGYAAHYGFPLMAPIVRDYLRYVHNGCHLTLAPSTWTIRQLQQDGYRRLRRWGRGVNSQHFHPDHRSAAMRARLLNGRDPDRLICLYVGRLANEKRVDLLLEVARTPGIALTIVGDGGKRQELEALFAGTDAYFMGYLFGDELAEAFASADLFAFTGTAETFGQVVQEAMASGLPCLVVDQGGVVDLVRDGFNGFVLPTDAGAFAAAAARLRDDPDLRRQMGYNSRHLAEQNPWEVVLSQLEGFYSEALRMNARLNRAYPPMSLLWSQWFNRATPADRTWYDRVS